MIGKLRGEEWERFIILFKFFSRSDQPSIIRTKKAEIRAERDRIASSPLMANGTTDQQRSDTPQSRASSSLSQRAAEIEKREI